jgi:ligand-binding SRPBCC domain-containing protein
MTTIKLKTEINAPLNQVFDLARNIDIHKQSTAKSKETAIAGVVSGLINLNDTVTWRGKHFRFFLTHKSVISEMEIPFHFVDKMVEGRFKSFKHTHTFVQKDDSTIMIDTVEYETPFGLAGKLFDLMVLKNYLYNFIAERNYFIKQIAENQ